MVAPNFDAWIGSTDVREPSAAAKAAEAWNHILDNATSIIVAREGVNLAAQTVRIEFQTWVTEERGDMAEGSHRSIWIFGVRDHATVADTDLKNGDKFVLPSDTDILYRIRDVILLPGEVQAEGERIS